MHSRRILKTENHWLNHVDINAVTIVDESRHNFQINKNWVNFRSDSPYGISSLFLDNLYSLKAC